jgi:hypothetical protein
VKQAVNKEDPTFKCCVHFYACICAFASDPKLSEEFSYYISLDKSPVPLSPTTTHSEEQQHLVAILSDEDGTGTCEVEVEVLREEAALLEATGITVADDVTVAQVMPKMCVLVTLLVKLFIVNGSLGYFPVVSLCMHMRDVAVK